MRKSDHRLSEDEIRAEAHNRLKEMRGAARAAEITEEGVALEKLKGLAKKEAARKAATGQAGKAKRAAEDATRKAEWGQEGKKTRAAEEATRWAKKKAEAAAALEETAAKQRQSRQLQRELHKNLTRKTHETHGAAWCAAEARKLNDSYFPGVSAHISLCAPASFALARPPA